MNWEAIGALGEIVGAISVIATLFYLSIQIRQHSAATIRSNEYAQAASVHESNSLFIQVFSPLLENSEVADIYRRAMAGDELSDTESLRFAMFANNYLAYIEALCTHHEIGLGFAEETSDLGVMGVVGPYIQRILRVPGARAWWFDEAKDLFTPSFVEEVNQLIEGHDV